MRLGKLVRLIFQGKIVVNGTCWEWRGYRNIKGYGQMYFAGRSSHLVHRWVWETLRATIPDGMQLDHTCRNTSCCNPAHLEVVTNEENQKRRIKEFCNRGHQKSEGRCKQCCVDKATKWNREHGYKHQRRYAANRRSR